MNRARGKSTGSSRSTQVVALAGKRLADGLDQEPEIALRHAAHELGIGHPSRLPPLSEVVEAACAERRIFGGTAHLERLTRLRHVALDAMRFLAAFSPHLVGGVLEGWAGNGAGIDLQVFTDDREALQLRLSELGIQPRVEPHLQEQGDMTLGRERLHFVAGETPVVLTVFPTNGIRQRTTANGRSRATIKDLEALMAAA